MMQSRPQPAASVVVLSSPPGVPSRKAQAGPHPLPGPGCWPGGGTRPRGGLSLGGHPACAERGEGREVAGRGLRGRRARAVPIARLPRVDRPLLGVPLLEWVGEESMGGRGRGSRGSEPQTQGERPLGVRRWRGCWVPRAAGPQAGWRLLSLHLLHHLCWLLPDEVTASETLSVPGRTVDLHPPSGPFPGTPQPAPRKPGGVSRAALNGCRETPLLPGPPRVAACSGSHPCHFPPGGGGESPRLCCEGSWARPAGGLGPRPLPGIGRTRWWRDVAWPSDGAVEEGDATGAPGAGREPGHEAETEAGRRKGRSCLRGDLCHFAAC